MFKCFLLVGLIAQMAWARSLQSQLGDLAAPSHIVIVTPQAQVHLEPSALKYESPASFLHHLSPLGRITAPQEETIVYVPASAAAAAPALVPFETVTNIGRSSSSPSSGELQRKADSDNKRDDNPIATQVSGFQTALQEGVNLLGEQFNQAAMAASQAGSQFWPTDPSSLKPADKLEQEIPAAQAVVAIDGRRFYAITPILPHFVDLGHAPHVFVTPVSAIRARSIQEKDMPLVAIPLPTANKPEALPLKAAADEEKQESLAEAEQQKDLGSKFLEVNALKDEAKDEKLSEIYKKDNLKTNQEVTAANNIAEAQARRL